MTEDKGFLRHIQKCMRHNTAQFMPLIIDGKAYGRVRDDIAGILAHECHHFTWQKGHGLILDPHLRDFDARTAAFADGAAILLDRFGKTARAEMYPVLENWGDKPLAAIDRAAVPWFGIRAFGIHVNGYVEKDDGIHIWIGQRAQDRLVAPGALDHLVAGGSPMGLSMHENLLKECYEEAGLPADLASACALDVGTISYRTDKMDGVRNDTLYVYDMKLPDDFQPRNTDGEVEAFYLTPAKDVAAIIHDTDRFKFNCNMVIIDFLMRHGVLTAAHPEYAALEEALAPMKVQPSP